MKAAKSTQTGSNNKLVSFNIKITPQEKKKIAALSTKTKKPASRAIMELVNRAVSDSAERMTASDLRRLPRDKRKHLLQGQAKLAAKRYEVIADGFDIVEY
jgi:hypothetical protein